MQELIEVIQKTIRQEIKQEISKELKKEISKELKPIVENMNQKFDNLENEINNVKDSLFIIEHEHGQKIDAIYDLVNLDREVNNPKFDEISKISKKSEQNYLHILNHENRISTLEKNNP